MDFILSVVFAYNILYAPKAPVVKDPIPYSYKVVDGKMVCAKENDKPRKSKQNKGIHLDMECCLDPLEIPNNNCFYGPEYKKLLDKLDK